MKFLAFTNDGVRGLAVSIDGKPFVGRAVAGLGSSLETALETGIEGLRGLAALLAKGDPVDIDAVELLPPLPAPGKILCVGLNYADHTAEGGLEQPAYPTIFGRFASSLIGHGAPMLRPIVSEQLDYEGELVAVIGRGGRNISKTDALDHVAAYSIFNDGSIRDYQLHSPQWTLGKNFNDTGSFGPILISADVLPVGAAGLAIETRLNGTVMQSASTQDLVFDVATLVSYISQALTLAPGDIIVTGTPAGVGAARTPPIYMQPGDICEVTIEGIGTLRNCIAQAYPSGGSCD